MAGVDQVVRRLPGTAVHDDRERQQPVEGGQAQVAELLRLGAIGESRVGSGRRWVEEDVGAVSRHGAIIGFAA